MITHYLKIKKQYADAIVDNGKNFEVRLNDREYQKGDEIIFWQVLNSKDDEIDHEIKRNTYSIQFVQYDFEDVIKKDYVVLGIKKKRIHQAENREAICNDVYPEVEVKPRTNSILRNVEQGDK